jgi:hypothetical protein
VSNLGKFSDWSRKQSKFLDLPYGTQKEVVWTGDASLARGKFGECWDFDFETDEGIKTYSIKNSGIVKQFDNYVKGDRLIIKRNIEGSRPVLCIFKPEEEAPF